MSWKYVIPHFQAFLENLVPTQLQREDALAKATSVKRCLDKEYYPWDTNPKTVFLIGSWGKNTAIRPVSDVDLLYVLPLDLYHRFSILAHNGQSALLQHVRKVLLKSFPNSQIKADGPVVVVDFASLKVELVPAFVKMGSGFVTPHTRDNGSWRPTDPMLEAQSIETPDSLFHHKVRHLVMMAKAWKRNCNVEIKSVALEMIACKYIWQCPYKDNSLLWYDWIVRDFFPYLLSFENYSVTPPGSADVIHVGDGWKSKVLSAHERAQKACYFEEQNLCRGAEDWWKKIFGDQFLRV